MEITIEQREKITQIVLSGRLDVVGMQQVDDRFQQATSHGQAAVVDLSAVDFIASLGIGMLFRAAKSMAQSGNKLVLLNAQGMVETVLKSSKMNQVMPLAEDWSEAVALSRAA